MQKMPKMAQNPLFSKSVILTLFDTLVKNGSKIDPLEMTCIKKVRKRHMKLTKSGKKVQKK